MSPYLTDFRVRRPFFEHSQELALAYLTAAHTEAEAAQGKKGFDRQGFEKQIHALFSRLGAGKIKNRGTAVADAGSSEWVRDLISSSIGDKTSFYGKVIDQFFEDIYPEAEPLPADIIHVTCTGYLSPSGAQKLVAKREAGRNTTVTHAYHMGCYASIPALRIASGLIRSSDKKADIVHTELCTLHLDPYSHSPEQLVIQSLFADGCIRYSLSHAPAPASFSVRVLKETTLSATEHAMTWQPSSRGMEMSLHRDVPLMIAGSIETTLDDLGSEAGLSRAELQEKAIFAIHPGGPKIIQTVCSLLNLRENQSRHSHDILQRYGNMSSATLPHIWESILADETVPHDTPIVSMAFGPGLTIASSLMNKVLL